MIKLNLRIFAKKSSYIRQIFLGPHHHEKQFNFGSWLVSWTKFENQQQRELLQILQTLWELTRQGCSMFIKMNFCQTVQVIYIQSLCKFLVLFQWYLHEGWVRPCESATDRSIANLGADIVRINASRMFRMNCCQNAHYNWYTVYLQLQSL